MKTYWIVCLVLLLSVAVFSCYSGSEKNLLAPARSTVQGKPKGPVKFSHALDENLLNVSVTFLRSAEEVHISFNGLDGLSIERQDPDEADFDRIEKNQSVDFDLTIKAPKGRSYVSIVVSGKFNGAARGTAYAIPVGEMDMQQRKSDAIQTIDDKPVHILPAETNWQ